MQYVPFRAACVPNNQLGLKAWDAFHGQRKLRDRLLPGCNYTRGFYVTPQAFSNVACCSFADSYFAMNAVVQARRAQGMHRGTVWMMTSEVEGGRT